MKQLIYNAQTGETTIVDVPDEEVPNIEEVPQPQSLEDRVNTLEETTAEVVVVLNDKGLIP